MGSDVLSFQVSKEIIPFSSKKMKACLSPSKKKLFTSIIAFQKR